MYGWRCVIGVREVPLIEYASIRMFTAGCVSPRSLREVIAEAVFVLPSRADGHLALPRRSVLREYEDGFHHRYSREASDVPPQQIRVPRLPAWAARRDNRAIAEEKDSVK